MDMGEWHIPDVIGPITGMRMWNILYEEVWGAFASESQLVLNSYAKSTIWKTKNIKAECEAGSWAAMGSIGKHVAPVLGCGCGLWGVYDFADFAYALNRDFSAGLYRSDVAFGRIKVWGKVIVADRGFRGQYAEILSLFENPSHPAVTKAIAEQYDVPIEKIGGEDNAEAGYWESPF